MRKLGSTKPNKHTLSKPDYFYTAGLK